MPKVLISDKMSTKAAEIFRARGIEVDEKPGLTKDELKEIFLQIGTYCGVPAAMDSFRIAKEVFREMGID